MQTPKAQKIAEYDGLKRDRDAHMLAVQDLVNGTVVWSAWHREYDAEGRFRVGMSRVDAANGGLMLVVYRYPGQSDSTNVLVPDEMASIGYINQALRNAMWDARNRWDAARKAA